IVSTERNPAGKAAEVRRIYQALNASAGDDIASGDVRITNEYLFTNADAFDGEWSLIADGEVVQSGALTASQLDIAPLSDKTIQVPIQRPADPAPGEEHFLRLSFKLKSATPW